MGPENLKVSRVTRTNRREREEVGWCLRGPDPVRERGVVVT